MEYSASGHRNSALWAWIKFKSKTPVVQAELLYTLDNGTWKDRRWLVIPAQIIPGKAMVQATLPAGVRVFFFNLSDARGLVVSSRQQVLNAAETAHQGGVVGAK